MWNALAWNSFVGFGRVTQSLSPVLWVTVDGVLPFRVLLPSFFFRVCRRRPPPREEGFSPSLFGRVSLVRGWHGQLLNGVAQLLPDTGLQLVGVYVQLASRYKPNHIAGIAHT